MEPPVLLVHGFASSFDQNWREPGLADLLADAGRTVIGEDLPGHGAADKPHDPADYADVDERVRSLLPADGAVDAVGFSMGARILLTLAAAEPHRFHRIVAGGVGSNLLTAHDPEALAAAIAQGAEAGSEAPALVRLFTRFAVDGGNDPTALAAFLRRPAEQLTPEVLARVTCPVLVVVGTDDDIAGDPDVLANALPDARVVRLRKVDHFATPRQFGFVDAVLDFLDAAPV
jgi:pimeloyl-ACP methyl ester carboxylesterase